MVDRKMVDRKKRDTIMKLFTDGASISEIAGKVGLSWGDVRVVIEDGCTERDLVIENLEKLVEIAKLKKQLETLKGA